MCNLKYVNALKNYVTFFKYMNTIKNTFLNFKNGYKNIGTIQNIYICVVYTMYTNVHIVFLMHEHISNFTSVSYNVCTLYGY